MVQSRKPPVPDSTPVHFSYSSHLLEDLGVNLYTSLPKALVEFVANAFDADSGEVRIKFNASEIDLAHRKCKHNFDAEVKKGNGSRVPLESRTLDPSVTITIADTGHGMTKDEIEEKLLVIGRRRREGIVGTEKTRSKKRVVMGRKGLGKLAGFGIAHKIEILTRAQGASYSTLITLDFDQLVATAGGPGSTGPATQEVPTIIMKSGGLKSHGTRITLSRLVYQTAKSADQNNVLTVLGRHFGVIHPKEFAIHVNQSSVKTEKRKYYESYPIDTSKGKDALVPFKVKNSETGREYTFDFRLRFLENKKYLPAIERGVRIYAHNRLAALPTMLDVNSSAHGFRYSDYLDGVVIADFIDELPTDYIATDRSDLRWDVHPLSDLRALLTVEVTSALYRFAELKSSDSGKKVKDDKFTKNLIAKADLPDQRRNVALKIATSLAASEDTGVDSAYYQETLPGIIDALSHSQIFEIIGRLAKDKNPDFTLVVAELTKLTGAELDEFVRIAEVRLKGIEALERIVKSVNFKAEKREKELHRLLKDNPWLINASYFEFLLSDERETVLAERLAAALKIGLHVPSTYSASAKEEVEKLSSNRRPDLVTILANESLKKIVIIELKAPNVPLHSEHLEQLQDYMRHTEDFLASKDVPKGSYQVDGYLIGSKADGGAKNSEKVRRLQKAIDDHRLGTGIKVVDLMELLSETKAVHRDFLKAHSRGS